MSGRSRLKSIAKNKNVILTKSSESNVLPLVSGNTKHSIQIKIHEEVSDKSDIENKPQHFVVNFNPLRNSREDTQNEKFKTGTQGHSFYNLLKYNIKNNVAEYSYWGKLKSEHADDLDVKKFIEIFNKNKSINKPTHLYITDFTFLWIANIADVLGEISDYEATKTLYFYQKNKANIEIWFKVKDIALISSTAKETGYHLNNLEIPSKDFKKLSPYVCNLRYPLIVKEFIKLDHFTSLENGEKYITKYENPFTSNLDLQSVLESTITSYAIPEFYFNLFPTYARHEILMAEALYIERENPRIKSAELSKENQIFLHYTKALEIILYELLLIKDRNDITFGAFLKYVGDDNYTYFINDDSTKTLQKEIKNTLPFLGRVLDIRNTLTHPDYRTDKIVKSEKRLIAHFRQIMLGLGCNGFLNEICRSYVGSNKAREHVTSISEFNQSQEVNYKKSA